MICIDASVAAKWIIEEPDSQIAVRLLALAHRRGHELVAPCLLAFELSNILRRECARHDLPIDEARRLFEDFLGVGVQLIHDEAFHSQAIVLAARFDLPASYDAHYLALCQREQCDFWTADRRLLNTLRGRLSFVRDLATLTDDAIQPAI